MIKQCVGIVFLGALFFLVVGCTINASLLGSKSQTLNETFIRGKGEKKILLLKVHGVISEKASSGLFGTNASILDQVKRQLDRARRDDQIAGLILQVSSPGGTVSASDVLLHELKRFKAEKEIPVVASFGNMAASGGYYISMCADSIMAQPSSITGSIGVISVYVNFKGLMDDLGIEAEVIRSGKMKGTGMPFEGFNDEQLAHHQKIVNTFYEDFLEHVHENRETLALEQLRKLADGRVYTAQEAKEIGLVDSIGYIDDAFERVKELAEIEEATLIAYTQGKDANHTVYSSSVKDNPIQAFEADSLLLLLQRLGIFSQGMNYYYLAEGA